MNNPHLRTDVPAYPGPPDREQWEREHGVKPLPIHFATDRFTNQAKLIIERDYTTLERDHALTQQARLEHVCERVKRILIDTQFLGGDDGKVTRQAFTENDHVFFDPKDGRFWVYPDPKRPTLGESLGKELPHTTESDE